MENSYLKDLEHKNELLSKEYERLLNEEGDLFHEWNKLRGSFFSRFFQQKKLSRIELELHQVFRQQEDNLFEKIIVEQDIEGFKAEEKLDNNIHEVTEKLFEKGLFLSDSIYSPEKIRSADFVRLEIDERAEKTYNHIPTILEIINLAEDYGLITQINNTEKKELYKELNKIDFGVDEEPYSYANVVYGLFEYNNDPFVYIHDDRDLPYDNLRYDSFEDKWKGTRYPFVVDNPCESIRVKYSQDSFMPTTARLEEVYYDLYFNANLSKFSNEFEEDIYRLSESYNNDDLCIEVKHDEAKKMQPRNQLDFAQHL